MSQTVLSYIFIGLIDDFENHLLNYTM